MEYHPNRPLHRRVLSGAVASAIVVGTVALSWQGAKLVAEPQAKAVEGRFIAWLDTWDRENCAEHLVLCLRGQRQKLEAVQAALEPARRKLATHVARLQKHSAQAHQRWAKLQELNTRLAEAAPNAEPVTAERKQMVATALERAKAEQESLERRITLLREQLAQTLADARAIDAQLAALPADLALVELEVTVADALRRPTKVRPLIDLIFAESGEAAAQGHESTAEITQLLGDDHLLKE